MGGQLRRSVDCPIVAGGDGANEVFKALFDFFSRFVVGGQATLHALQYGSGGTGTDYWDGGSPFGDNAFAVFAFPPTAVRVGYTVYYLIQYTSAFNFGTAPGNPGQTRSANGSSNGSVGIAVAIGRDGVNADADPWNGDSDADGTDLKGATVWDVAGGTTFVWPRSNNAAGGHSALREDTYRIWLPNASSGGRIHMEGDSDFITIMGSFEDNGAYNVFHAGPYTENGTFTHEIPFVVLQDDSLPLIIGAYNDTTGSADKGAAVIAADLSQVRGVSLDWMSTVVSSTVQPNAQPGTNKLDLFSIGFYISEGSSDYMGQIDRLLITANTSSNNTLNTDAGLDYFVGGDATQASVKCVMGWDTTTTPQSTVARGGVESDA